MTLQLTLFRAAGLHGDRTIELPISDDRLFLVGANGAGKSTVVTLLYLVLSRQWRRLSEYSFSEISIELAGERLHLTRAVVRAGMEFERFQWRVSRRLLPPNASSLFEASPVLWSRLSTATDQADILELSRVLATTPARILEIRNHLAHGLVPEEALALQRAGAFIKERVGAQILYLPTYRRIERDLKAVFPELETDIRRYRSRQSDTRRDRPDYLELVEFGMEDVEATFRRVLTGLKEQTRSALKTLTESYLRDVVRGEADTYETSTIAELGDDTITRILNRVEAETLDDQDKRRLRAVIDQVSASGPDTAKAEQRYVAHFFAKLVEADRALTAQEQPLVRFIDACSHYLQGKRLVYDDKAYTLRVVLDSGAPLRLRDLSSGEKQIVSLFSHLFLAGEDSFAILIDEPELSLAIEWQRRVLPDLWASGRCALLVAATHSPFVFDNEFDPEAHDLGEFLHHE